MDRLLSKMQTLQFAARKGGKGGNEMETYLLIGVVIISLITLGVLIYHQFSKKTKAENYIEFDDFGKPFSSKKQYIAVANETCDSFKKRYAQTIANCNACPTIMKNYEDGLNRLLCDL